MYSDVKQSKAFLIGLILLLLVIAAVAAWSLTKGSAADITEESAAAIQDTVQKSALQCYVVEGVYPPDLQYLQEHYGLQINTDAFYVTYDVFASNQPPVVVVTPNEKAQ
jgi:hypothetical protein